MDAQCKAHLLYRVTKSTEVCPHLLLCVRVDDQQVLLPHELTHGEGASVASLVGSILGGGGGGTHIVIEQRPSEEITHFRLPPHTCSTLFHTFGMRPRSVMMPVMSEAGATSNEGFHT